MESSKAGQSDIGANALGGDAREDGAGRAAGSEDGRAGQQSPLGIEQTTQPFRLILAGALLVIVLILAVAGLGIVADQFPGNQSASTAARLVFALFCGIAGALVGGSAEVRSQIGLQGHPAALKAGGAAAMFVLGLALPAGSQPQEPTYRITIHSVAEQHEEGTDKYQIRLLPLGSIRAEPARSQAGSASYSLEIPRAEQEYKAEIEIRKTSGEIAARCVLVFQTYRDFPSAEYKETVAASNDVATLYFRPSFVGPALNSRKGSSLRADNCLEGQVESRRDLKVQLQNRFLLATRSWHERMPGLSEPRLKSSQIVRAIEVLAEPVEAGEAAPATPPVPKAEAPLQPAPNRPAAGLKGELAAMVDDYARGRDVDRSKLYAQWGEIAPYVVESFRANRSGNPLAAGRLLDLVCNALNQIEGGRYRPALLNPEALGAKKPTRLLSEGSIPAFQAPDYKAVVDDLDHDDYALRRAAHRLVRLYPANRFWHDIKAQYSRTDVSSEGFARMAEAAVYFYFNRIVEYQGSYALDDTSRKWIAGNHAEGRQWVAKAVAAHPGVKALGAVLDYGRAITFWDRGEDGESVVYFRSMLDTLRQASGPYPANPQHVATALVLLEDRDRRGLVREAKQYGAGEERILDRGSYELAGDNLQLRAAPDAASRLLGSVRGGSSAQMLMKVEGWDLVKAGSQLGWVKRATRSASAASSRL